MITAGATRRMSAALALAAILAAGCASASAPFGGPAPSRASSPGRKGDSKVDVAPSPVFVGEIERIDSVTQARLSFSWHEGCPVGLQDLRLLTLSYWGFDGRAHRGELVVHRDVARDVVTVFRSLFRAEFPIRRMRLVDEYGGDDDRSMAANNTSAFNCRETTGHPGVWSEHSYGRAIDINPLNNPYVAPEGTVLPPAGAPFADRSRQAKGMIHDGDVVVEAFASIGWEWGGAWSSIKDYQHFSATGR